MKNYINLNNIYNWDSFVDSMQQETGYLFIMNNDNESDIFSKDRLKFKSIKNNYDKWQYDFVDTPNFWKDNGYNPHNISFGGLENSSKGPGTRYKLINNDELTFKKELSSTSLTFDKLKGVVDAVSDHLNVEVFDAWVSIVYPGYSAPSHIDDAPEEKSWWSLKNVFRFSIALHDPIKYQALIIGDEYYHNIPKFHAVRWSHPSKWHGLLNCSKHNNYLIQLIGAYK